MPRRRKTFVLQADEHDELKELQFELDFQSTLTLQERFNIMFQMSNIVKRMLIQNGHRKPVEIAQRP